MALNPQQQKQNVHSEAELSLGKRDVHIEYAHCCTLLQLQLYCTDSNGSVLAQITVTSGQRYICEDEWCCILLHHHTPLHVKCFLCKLMCLCSSDGLVMKTCNCEWIGVDHATVLWMGRCWPCYCIVNGSVLTLLLYCVLLVYLWSDQWNNPNWKVSREILWMLFC